MHAESVSFFCVQRRTFMLLSIALILLVGITLGWVCKKCKLPSLLGMLATGILLGPYVLDLIDGSILSISSEIRKIALIIILTRAGLSLDISGIKKIGRPAVMMCFVPASFELIGMILLAPKLLGLSMLEAAIMGAVLAAVSPAVVFLFVLVGATINISYLGNVGIKALIVIAGALVLRMLGVFVCLLGTNLNTKERAFSMMAYTPKATVQAAIGGIPLSLGLGCGDMVLTVAVLAIVLTAPLGAFAIDLSYKKLLER